METNTIEGGTVTSPRGFTAGATCAGIKKIPGSLDLGILQAEVPCLAAGLFTANRIKAAPVILSQYRLLDGIASAVVVNSGCANASTGEQGLADAARMAELAAEKTGIPPEDVLIASTGVIGQPLPIELIKAGIENIALSADGGHVLAKAMMTTDTVPKETAVGAEISGRQFTIGGVAKGSGMIHPNLATMLCFLTTDAAVELEFLQFALRQAADISFNMISVDGDTSPSDTLLIMASGLAENKTISMGSKEAEIFQEALNRVCVDLAKSIARDGEGATRLIEVTVHGANSDAEAKRAARTIVSSPLVKAAVHGADPNWGRILAALGRSGAEVEEPKIELYIGETHVIHQGKPLDFDKQSVIRTLKNCEVPVILNLNLGASTATAWGCDLSQEYVVINSHYTT